MSARVRFAALCLPLLALTARAEETQIRDLAGFDAIEVGGSVDLSITQGSDFLVEVSGPGDSLDELITEVHGRTLKITQRPQDRGWFFFGRGDEFSVNVTMPRLRALQASGGTDVTTHGRITGEQLEVTASGGSDLRLDLDVTTLSVRTSGGSDTVLSGRAMHLEVRSSGGSDLSATQLQALEADVRSSGGSDVEIDVAQRLLANASGGSDIYYSGNPQFVEADSSGGADVRAR